jgi:hypothetical protein
MAKIIVKYKKEIEEYCAENHLSVERVFNSPRCYDHESLIFQHADPEKGKMGLLDETPAAVTLAVFLEDGKLRFEQTEHTRKYLGVAPQAVAV